MKKILKFIVIIAVLAAAIFIGAKLIHKCDDCDKIFIGTGYKANILSDAVSSNDKVICRDCAEIEHIFEIGLGKNVEDFKRGMFD